DVFRHHGCANCHVIGAKMANPAEQARWRSPAPDLQRLGERLNADWVAAWIEHPQQLRPTALMPMLFHGQRAKTEQQTIADLAAFLTSGQKESKSGSDSVPATDAEIEAGLQSYESLGCMGCHRFTAPNEADSLSRTTLHFVGAKFRMGQIAAFLRDPQ